MPGGMKSPRSKKHLPVALRQAQGLRQDHRVSNGHFRPTRWAGPHGAYRKLPNNPAAETAGNVLADSNGRGEFDRGEGTISNPHGNRDSLAGCRSVLPLKSLSGSGGRSRRGGGVLASDLALLSPYAIRACLRCRRGRLR